MAAVFGAASIAVFLLFLRNRAVWTARKTPAIISGVLCFLALGVNVAFILYATHECRHMFDQLHPWNESLMESRDFATTRPSKGAVVTSPYHSSSGELSRFRSFALPYSPRVQNLQVQNGGFPFAFGENLHPIT